MLASFINAPYPNELLLQHIPTVAGLAILTFAIVCFSPSPVSIFCCIVFLWLHILGARWIYSFVPYDPLFASITGHTLSEIFGWQRNHYDRLVHLASGIFGVPPVSNLLQSYCGVKPLSAAVLSVMCVLAVGAIYEIVEWQIAITLSPAMAESYNGQQGDVWDPQKDMALALIGGSLAAVCFSRWTPQPQQAQYCSAQGRRHKKGN